VPGAAVPSPALRTAETRRLAKEAGGWGDPERSRRELSGGVSSVPGEIQAASPMAEVPLLVSHEPGNSLLAEFLIVRGALRLPTGELARIDVKVADWTTVGPGCGQMAWLVPPRHFPKRSFDFADYGSHRQSTRSLWR